MQSGLLEWSAGELLESDWLLPFFLSLAYSKDWTHILFVCVLTSAYYIWLRMWTFPFYYETFLFIVFWKWSTPKTLFDLKVMLYAICAMRPQKMLVGKPYKKIFLLKLTQKVYRLAAYNRLDFYILNYISLKALWIIIMDNCYY